MLQVSFSSRTNHTASLCGSNDEEEQARGITIFTSVVLLSFDYEGKNYLLQLNDTPGHISFTGEVSRALRGSDGVVILVDALEGVMTQTETNIRLAVGEERCKPVLFINKVDRLIKELKLPPKKVNDRLVNIAIEVNRLIKQVAPEMNWKVSFDDGSIAIGSAKHGWGFTIDILKRKGINPNVVFEKYAEGDEKWLRDNLPLDDALLGMIVKHLPSPIEAQKYKIPRIWDGDLNSEVGKSLLNVDPNGPLLGMITKLFIDPKSKRPILIGRVFSGTLEAGKNVWLAWAKRTGRIQRLGVMEITDILDIPKIPAGNLFAMYGFVCPSGETIMEQGSEIPPFKEIKYVAEPVVSVAIQPIDPQQIDKLEKAVRLWTSADPTANFRIDKESGEYILSGIDPLQLDILQKRINEMVPIRISEPIIVYREVPTKRGVEIHTKSNNGHNRIKLYLEPLDQTTIDLIRKGLVRSEQDPKERAQILKKAGWSADEAKNVWEVYGFNVLVDKTKGAQRLDRIKTYLQTIFIDFCNGASLAREPLMNSKVVITDATVHVDPAHTGYAEILSMMISALHISFLTSDPKIYEPILKIDIRTPVGTDGVVVGLLNRRRGVVKSIERETELVRISGEIPAAETQGLADELRSSTQGKAFWGYEPAGKNHGDKKEKEITRTDTNT